MSPFKVDYDHALAKSLALKAQPSFAYVLLMRIPPTANRSHGGGPERRSIFSRMAPATVVSDSRIMDKVLHPTSNLFRRPASELSRFDLDRPWSGGLTVKQKGRVAFGLGGGSTIKAKLIRWDP